MDHSTNQVPGMELPNPQPDSSANLAEQSVNAPTSETASAQALEQGVSQTSPADPVFDMNLGPQPAVSTSAFDASQMTSQTPSSGITSTMPAIADDNDLIEKEWVEKAKQIVERTKSDPNLQSREMTKMRLDYLKKRYNKEVKLIEE